MVMRRKPRRLDLVAGTLLKSVDAALALADEKNQRAGSARYLVMTCAGWYLVIATDLYAAVFN